mgnify:CR=1 FL=1
MNIKRYIKYSHHVPTWITPVAVFCLALAVRLIYNLTVARGYVAVYDAGQYERIAQHLLNEHCFCDYNYLPTIERGPIWPAIIASVYFLFGPQNLYARLLLSLIGSGTCLILYYFGKDLFKSKRYGLLAGSIGALYPGLFVYDGWLYSESVYTFLFLLCVYSLYRFQCTTQRRWIITSGIALALALLTRTNEIIAFGMIASWALIVGYYTIVPRRTILFASVGIALIAVVVILPWSIRNYVVSHKIVPITTGGDIVLAGAYNDSVFNIPTLGNVGMWVTPQQISPSVVYHWPCLGTCSDLWGEHPELKKAAVHWITTHLTLLPKLWLLHFWNIWVPGVPDGVFPFDQAPASRHWSSYLIRLMIRRIPIWIILLAGCGTIVLWRTKWRDLLPIVLAIGWTIVQCILLYGSIRFRAPIEPMLVLLATGALIWGWTVTHRKVLHLPIQNSLKMRSSKSSLAVSPVTSPRSS